MDKENEVDKPKKIRKPYLSAKEFYEEIMISKEKDELTPKAAKMMIAIANGVLSKKRYSNPSDRDDCLQQALYQMFLKWRNFNTAYSNNAFAFFTEIAKRGMAAGYQHLYKKRGDPNKNVKVVSYHSQNDGEGMFNII